MKIAVINGAPVNTRNGYREVLKKCVYEIVSAGDNVEIVDLENLTINQCIGCWTCWVKTPGSVFTILENEIHHVSSYEKRPSLGVIVFAGEDTDSEDLEIIFDV